MKIDQKFKDIIANREKQYLKIEALMERFYKNEKVHGEVHHELHIFAIALAADLDNIHSTYLETRFYKPIKYIVNLYKTKSLLDKFSKYYNWLKAYYSILRISYGMQETMGAMHAVTHYTTLDLFSNVEVNNSWYRLNSDLTSREAYFAGVLSIVIGVISVVATLLLS